MTSRVESLANIIDLIIKGLIALAVAIGGFFFKDIYQDIQKLKDINADKSAKIAVLEFNSTSVDRRLEQIEKKVDRIWEAVRK